MENSYGFSIQTIPLSPGQIVKTHFRGDFLRNLKSTDGEPHVGFDEGPRTRFPEATSYNMPPGMTFDSFTLENRNAGAITVEVAVALGEVGYSALQTSSTLDVNVLNQPAPLAPEERPGYVPVGGSSSRVYGGPSTVQLIDPAVNTAGVILRWAQLFGSSTTSFLMTKNSTPTGVNDVGAACLMARNPGYGGEVSNIFLPAGFGLWVVQSSGITHASSVYEVL